MLMYSTLPSPERYRDQNPFNIIGAMRASDAEICAACTHSVESIHGRSFPNALKCSVKDDQYCTDVNPKNRCDKFKKISKSRALARTVGAFIPYMR